jgi:hypothetical protein
MGSAADALKRVLSAKQGKAQQITDPTDQAIARRLEERGITKVPGLPQDEPELTWYDIALELHRNHEEFVAQREAQRKADEENPPNRSAAEILRDNLVGGPDKSSNTMPLNGAQVLRAALAGGSGTVNGGEG